MELESSQKEQQIISELRKSLAWSDLVLANLNEGVVVVEKTSKIIFVNDFFSVLVGVEKILLLGQSLLKVLPLKQHGSISNSDIGSNSVIEGNITQLEGVFDVAIAQKQLVLDVSSILIKKFDQVVIVIRDITDKQKQDLELQFRNSELETMNRVMVGRELKMYDLKAELAECKKHKHK